jgi:hypothetical protein
MHFKLQGVKKFERSVLNIRGREYDDREFVGHAAVVPGRLQAHVEFRGAVWNLFRNCMNN